jgi:hypothetical protein
VLDLIAALDRGRPERRSGQAGREEPVVLVEDAPGEPKAYAAPGLDPVAPRVAQQGGSAYLKIADGCSAPCAFCAIPLIKGPLRSRTVDEVVADARLLAERGVLELVLVAQDTTAYGRDRGEPDALPALLDALVKAVPQVPWIRLMYAYPQHISQRLIEIMRGHARIGYEILKDSPSRYLRLGASIARHHHERFDALGYPDRIGGDTIPLEARIVALVDVFDALTTDRPYKNAWTMGKALGFLRERSGTHFDPACVLAFFERLDDVRLVRKRLRDAPPREGVGPHAVSRRVLPGSFNPRLR